MIFRTTEYFNEIGRKRIPDECPDCGNKDCLELKFYQVSIEAGFLITVTKKVTGILFCHHTQTEISPVLWTEEIENRFNTEKSKLDLQPKSIKVVKSSLIGILVILLVIGGIIGYLMLQKALNEEPTGDIVNTSIGDKFRVNYAASDTWYMITAMDGDTLYLKQHKDYNKAEDFPIDLDNSNFTVKRLKISKLSFKERNFVIYEGGYGQYSGYINKVEKQE